MCVFFIFSFNIKKFIFCCVNEFLLPILISVENGPLDGFIIDSDSGKIYLAHKLDFETTSKYTINIAVDDGGIFQVANMQ